MKLLTPLYSIRNFIICLESAKMSSLEDYYLEPIFTTHWPYIHVKILKTIMSFKKTPYKEKYKFKYLLSSYVLPLNKKNHNINKKYTQRFTYNHLKFYKDIPVYDKERKDKTIWVIKRQALIYIYLIYKILQSKNPVYSFFCLITN